MRPLPSAVSATSTGGPTSTGPCWKGIDTVEVPCMHVGRKNNNGMVLESGRQVHLALIIWNLAAEDK